MMPPITLKLLHRGFLVALAATPFSSFGLSISSRLESGGTLFGAPAVTQFGYGTLTQSHLEDSITSHLTVAPGTIKMGAQAVVSFVGDRTNGFVTAVFSTARVEYNDFITFDSSGLTGTNGTGTLNFYFPGTLSAFALGAVSQTTARIDFTVIAPQSLTFGERLSTDGWNYLTIPTNRWIQIPLSFTYGQPMYLVLDVKLQANASSGFGSAGFDIDYGQSLYFGGVTDVMSPSGAVTDFTALGSDGFDYARSYVPADSTRVPDTGNPLLFLAIAAVGLQSAHNLVRRRPSF